MSRGINVNENGYIATENDLIKYIVMELLILNEISDIHRVTVITPLRGNYTMNKK